MVAQEAREIGDARRRPGRRARRTRPAGPRPRRRRSSPSALASAATSRPGSAANQISSATACRRELGRRTERGELAARDDRDPVAQLLGFVHRVRREQHGDAAVAQVADELPRGGAGVRVHAGGRLVEEHDVGPADRARTRATAAAPARPRAAAPACRATSRSPTVSSSVVGRFGVVVVRGEEARAARAASAPDRARPLAA